MIRVRGGYIQWYIPSLSHEITIESINSAAKKRNLASSLKKKSRASGARSAHRLALRDRVETPTGNHL